MTYVVITLTTYVKVMIVNVLLFCCIKFFFKRFLKFRLISMAYKGINRISKFIKVQKDTLPTLSGSDTAYGIDCRLWRLILVRLVDV